MDMTAKAEMETTRRADRSALRSARLRLKAAFLEARKADWTDERIDELYPYPFYTVDPKKRTVTVANSIQILVRANGKIAIKFLKPLKDRHFDRVSHLVIHYHMQIVDTYRSTVNELFGRAVPDPQSLPPQYHGLLPMIEEVVGMMPLRQGFDNRATLFRWIDRACPFWPAKAAGIHKINGLGQMVRIEVSRLIEAMPVFSEIKRSFNWTRMVQELSISAWNRFASVAPYYVELKKDNKRLATPFFLAHFWSYLSRGGSASELKELLSVPPREAVSWWRRKFLDAGLTPAAWRWVTHLPPPQLSSLVTAGGVSKGTVALLNYLVARQVPAQQAICFLKKSPHALFFSEFNAEDHRIAHLLEALVREWNVGIKKCPPKERRDYQATLSEKVSDVLDFLQPRARQHEIPTAEELAKIDAVWPLPAYERAGEELVVPRGVGLKWFIERSTEWHRRMQSVWNERSMIERAISDGRLAKLKWESALQSCEIGEFCVVPLTTAIELGEEGAEMHHCVAGYAYTCIDDGHRIFSIRISGERAATLEIYPAGSANEEWRVAQVRGKRNAQVARKIADVAQEVARRYARAAAQSQQLI
jgi:hypothetical protein